MSQFAFSIYLRLKSISVALRGAIYGLTLVGLFASLGTCVLSARDQEDSPTLVMQTGHSGVIRSVDISADGKLAATGSDDASIRIWSLPMGLELRRMSQGAGVHSVAFSPDGHSVAALSYQNVAIWDVDSGVRKRTWSYFDSNPYLQGGIAFTPDGSKVVVADRVRVFVWNIISGKIDHVELFHQGIGCFAHQPGSNLVALCQVDSVVLWDTQGYKIARTIGPAISTFAVDPQLAAAYREGVKKLNAQRPREQALPEEIDPALVRGVDFSRDGKSVVTNHTDGSLRIWNGETGTQVVVVKEKIEDNLAVGSGSHKFATVAGDKIVLRSLATAAGEQELNPPKSFYTEATPFAWVNGKFSPLRFSPDGHLLVEASVRQNRLIVWDLDSQTVIDTGQNSVAVPLALASDDHRHLYTITGQIPKSWNLSEHPEIARTPEGMTSAVLMSRDGKWLAWNGVKAFEVFSTAASTNTHYSLPICHDDKSLITCKELGQSMVEIMGFSEDDSRLFVRETANVMGALSTGTATSFYAINIKDQSLKTLFALPLGGIVTDALCPERNLIAFVQALSPNQLIAGVPASPLRIIRLFDVMQSKEVEGPSFAAATDEMIQAMVDHTHEDNPENFPDLAKARIGGEQGLRNGESVTKIVFSPGGMFLAATYQFHGVTLWRLDDKKLVLRTGPHLRPDGKPGSTPTAVAFSPDNRWLVGGWDDGTIKRFDTNTGAELAAWPAHGSSVTSLSFVPGSDLLISTGEDGTVKFWNSADAHLEFTLSPGVNPYDWAAVSSNGLFDGGSDGWSRFLWRFHNSIFDTQPIELYFRQYFRPGLMRDFFSCRYSLNQNCGRIEPARSLNSIKRVLPNVNIVSVQGEHHTRKTVSVTVDVHVQKGSSNDPKTPRDGVYDVRLFRDGQLVAQYPAAEPTAKENETSIMSRHDLAAWRRTHAVKVDGNGRATVKFANIRVPERVDANAVKFTAYAFNSDRVKSVATRPFEFKLPSARDAEAPPRTAFLVTMGVNANESPNLNLDLAVSSAENARRLLKAKLEDDHQEVVEIPLYSDFQPDSNQVRIKSAKKADLKAVLDLLADRSVDPVVRQEVDPKHQLRPAEPDDTIILYIASHGYVDPEGTFYLMPYDTGANWGITEDILTGCQSKQSPSSSCKQARDLLMHSISSYDLAAWWKGVDGGSMVMVLDSCHSGAVSGKEFRPAPLGDPGFGQLAYDKGMVIFSASQPAQTERGEWVSAGKGLTLLTETLETAANSSPDKSIIEWLHESAQHLPILTTELYPSVGESENQIPVLLDFSNETRQAALAAGDPLGNP